MSLLTHNPITHFAKGMHYVWRGFGLIHQQGLRAYVAIPFLINAILFSLGIWLITKQFGRWMEHLLPNWLSWLEWLLWPIFALIFLFVVFYTFTLLANVIAAPFNSLLAEKVEQRLNGLATPAFQGYKSLPSLIVRTVRSELKKLWYMTKWLIILLLITIIPGLNLIAPFAWILFGAWMMAVQYIDYPMGNHELYFETELKALKQHRDYALGFGWLISMMTSIPILNFLSIPVGVAGATVLWVELLAKDYAR